MVFHSTMAALMSSGHLLKQRQARNEATAWLLCSNKSRLHSTLTYVSPMQFGEN